MKQKHDSNIIKKAWIPTKHLKAIINKANYYIKDESFVEKKEFIDCSFSGVIENSELEQNIFRRCTFENFQMSGCLFKNVRFNDCCTLNTDIKHSKLIRSEFNDSKLLGISFDSSIGTEVTFLNSNCQFADFRKTKFKRTIFENCILREADFQGADLRGVTFSNCDLHEAQFSFAILDGTNFCSSRIEGIKIQTQSLRGAIVDYHQAAYLGARLLGVKIR
jgi:uncharacterized protein YjbI with pentapeptide repeats